MKFQTLAVAALVAVAGQSFAQSTTTTPSATPPNKATMQSDRDAVKADKEKLKQDKKAGASADVIKADEDKLHADQAKLKSDRQAKKDAKSGSTASNATPSTTTK